jgi:thioredoxin reductase
VTAEAAAAGAPGAAAAPDRIDVLVVGGGPAGLAAAVELRALGTGRVLVVEREAALGGLPRDCRHPGFGWRDLRRLLSGPAYARRRAALARAAGVETATETTAIGWAGATALVLAGPAGPRTLEARAVLLATGCRERPRAARLVPGSRPHGVLTTGSLQRLVHDHGIRPGRRAVVVGAEHVSFSAVETLAAGGCEVAAMVTEHPAHQTYAALRWLVAARRRVPILAGARVTAIHGGRRVEEVDIVREGGGRERIACDTVVFTGDWIPEHELARAGGLELDPATGGPSVDTRLRTSVRGVFAAGNLLRGAEAADVAALEGRAAARSLCTYLRDGAWPELAERVRLVCEPPLRWIAPGWIAPGCEPPPRGRFALRVEEPRARATLTVRQGSRVLHAARLARAIPNRPIALGAGWIGAVSGGGDAVTLSLA